MRKLLAIQKCDQPTDQPDKTASSRVADTRLKQGQVGQVSATYGLPTKRVTDRLTDQPTDRQSGL